MLFRSVTENEIFYIPTIPEWRAAPNDRKQGSGGSVDTEIAAKCLQRLRASVERGMRDYEEALKDGVAPEQARLLLPAYAMYVRWRWTVSLNGLLHFLSLRLGHGAQYEIVEYANVINDIVEKHYPITTRAWNEFRINS